MYAIVENAKVLEFPILDLRQRFPSVSFPQNLTDADLPSGVVRVHFVDPPSFDRNTHKAIQQAGPVLDKGRWEIRYDIVSMSQDEVDQMRKSAAQDVLQERGQRLAQSDWTQVADAPVDKAAWAAYRQALRDITSQPGFPFNVNWPVAPA